MEIFNRLHFYVNEKLFFEVFKNPDKGFGYCVKLDKEELSELQVDTLDFLIRCREKNLLGTLTFTFETTGIGEITKLERRVEDIRFENGKYFMSATY